MNKILKRLLWINLSISSAFLLSLGLFLRIPLQQFIFLFLTSLILSFVLSLVIDRLYFKPIEDMQNVTHQIAKGNFKNRLPVLRNDELGGLASNLNQMSIELQNKIAEMTRDQNELKAILSSMIEGVIVIGRNERVLLLNDPLYTMLDLRSKDSIGRPYWEVIRNEEINSTIKEAISRKQSLSKEITIITPQEAYFKMQVSSVLLETGQLSGLVAVFHDITELKKLARLRSEFVANVSHELKTPLTSIKGFVETLKDGALNDKEKAEKFLQIIQKHTERLENLVDDLLSLSALESKDLQLHLEKISLLPVVQSVVAFLKEKLEDRQLKIVYEWSDNLPMVLVDRSKLEQVFFNLLDNAVKFSTTGGLVTIKAQKEAEFVRIDFQDSGIGIDPIHLSRIFERFYRVDKGRSRELGGTGLGLSIVKHIILSHHGKVGVQSELNKGSTFSVYLPTHLAV